MAVAEKIMPATNSADRDSTPRRVQDAVMLDLAFRIGSMYRDLSRFDAESLAKALLATVGRKGQTTADELLAQLQVGRSKDAARRLARLIFPDLPA